MKVTLLLVGIAALVNRNVAGPCRRLTIASDVQGLEILQSNVASPYQLAIDRDTNTLFFSYTSNNSDNIFDSVYINLKDNTSGLIDGVVGGFASAVDHQQQIVYIGGKDGIYRFDYNTKKAVKLDITNENIWQLFFKDGLYFTTYPSEKVYLYKDGVVKLVPELKDTKAMLVAVDKNNNLFFAQGGELKRVVNGEIENLGDYNVNAFNTDASGNLYFSTPDAVYKLADGTIKKVVSVENIYGFAIEGDNTFIFAGDNSVVRMKETPTICVEDEKEYDSKFLDTNSIIYH